jgi:hypothetical protein
MANRNRPPSKGAAAILGIVIVAFGLVIVHDFLAKAPPFAALRAASVQLDSLNLVVPGGKYGSDPYVEFRWRGGHARLNYLCFLASGCTLPPSLKPLHAGDRVTLWLDSRDVWQVGEAPAPLLGYEEVRTAYQAAMKRHALVYLPLWLSTVALTAFALLKRRARDRSLAG